jgi:hypothetical protein
MQFAYYFLKRMGANLNNSYLFTAVVAWLRAEVGYDLRAMYNKNNPLNIRHSPFQSGSRKTASNGSFALFATLKDGAYAAADLIVGAGHDWRNYWRIVAAARRSSKDDAGAQTQARDFIEAIALSAWDAGRYGLGKNQRTVATYSETDVSIFNIWLGITGKLPTIKVTTDKPKPPPKKVIHPRPPRPLPAPTSRPDYIDGARDKGFYAASRPPSDLGNLPSM